MNEDPRSSRARTLGLVLSAALAAAPMSGCSESHPAQADAATLVDAAPSFADASPRLDAGVSIDAAASVDAALAMADAASLADANLSDAWEDDPDAPDAYYDGVRG